MDILYLMILCSVSLGVIFLIIFIVNAKRGQFEDDESPAIRILFEDETSEFEDETSEKKQLDKKNNKEV